MLAGLPACGGNAEPGQGSAKPAASGVRAAGPGTPLRVPADRCGTPAAEATPMWFRAGDGTWLDGAVAGTGPVGAVLIHEYPGPMCGWWPYAAYLARHGVRALLFDLRCFGDSACPTGAKGTDPVSDVRGAVDALRRRGARRVVLVGASLGGTIAVVAGARLHPRPAAVVDLSGEADLSGFLSSSSDLDAVAAARQLAVPSLFVVSRDDRYTSLADMRRVYRRTAATNKRLIVEPAAFGHGWLIVDRPEPARTVLAFIRAARSLRRHHEMLRAR